MGVDGVRGWGSRNQLSELGGGGFVLGELGLNSGVGGVMRWGTRVQLCGLRWLRVGELGLNFGG